MAYQGIANAMTGAPEKFQSSAHWRRIEADFDAMGDPVPVLAGLTDATDTVARDAFAASFQRSLPHSASMFAVGAYGDSQTFPYSGADLVILVDTLPDLDPLREAKGGFARFLWDAGLRLNFGVRTLAECLEFREQTLDLAISLLDRRFLAGDGALRARLEDRLPAALTRSARIMATRLITSTRARHAKFGNTPHRLEPDVKESPGGLRDLRVIHWIAKLFPESVRHPELDAATRALSTARCLLHYHAGRDANLLDREAQAALAGPPFNVSPRDYFRAAHLIYNEARHALEAADRGNHSLLDNFREYRARLSNAEFTVARDRLLLRHPAQLESDPALILRLVEFVARHGVAPAHETERRLEGARDLLAGWLSTPRPIWPALKSALAAPHAPLALRTLHRAGLAPALFTAWDDLQNATLPDAGRQFTADEHALRALEALAELPAATDEGLRRFAALALEIDDPALLALAVVFADVAPARVALSAVQFQMPEEDRNTLAFLIERTTELAAALTLDIDDPATATRTAHLAGTIERLKLLTLAAYASLAANQSDQGAHQFDRLWKLYSVTRRELTRELETERIQQPPAGLGDVAEFLKGFPSRYLHSHSYPEIQSQYRLYERSRPTGVAVQLDAADGAHKLTIVTRDRPYLFASFTAVLTSFHLDVRKAEAFSNNKGVVLDTFTVSDPNRALQTPAEVERLYDTLQRVATGRLDARRLLRPTPPHDPKKRTAPPDIRIDSTGSDTATLIEITTEDRPGLLYSLSQVFALAACNIDIVLVDTKGHRAIDLFYVAYEGHKLSPDMTLRLREQLLAAC
jgi:[protein-PII] uridylyltransferase